MKAVFDWTTGKRCLSVRFLTRDPVSVSALPHTLVFKPSLDWPAEGLVQVNAYSHSIRFRDPLSLSEGMLTTP